MGRFQILLRKGISFNESKLNFVEKVEIGVFGKIGAIK